MEAYFKNDKFITQAQRLFHNHFELSVRDLMLTRNTIISSINNFRNCTLASYRPAEDGKNVKKFVKSEIRFKRHP